MKRLYLIVAMLVVIALVFTGCTAPAVAPAGDEAGGEAAADAAAPADGDSLECTDEIGCVEIAPDEPLRVGYMLTISGATAFLGEDSLGGIEIAVDDRAASCLTMRSRSSAKIRSVRQRAARPQPPRSRLTTRFSASSARPAPVRLLPLCLSSAKPACSWCPRPTRTRA